MHQLQMSQEGLGCIGDLVLKLALIVDEMWDKHDFISTLVMGRGYKHQVHPIPPRRKGWDSIA